jgi:hypothetical protein
MISVAHPGFQGGDFVRVISWLSLAQETDRRDRQPGPQGRPALVNIQALIDDAKCFETVRAMR